MSELDDKLNELEIKAQNQATEPQEIVAQVNTQEMSEGQARALLDTVSKPEGALGLHLAKSITSKVQEGAGKERLEKTADKIIDSGLKTFEANADNDLNKANKSAEDVYFESKRVQLGRGGIKKATSQKIMTRVVKTDDLFSDINFYLFSWWIIAINNYVANLSEFPKVFRVIVHLLFTIPYSAILICCGTLLGIVAYISKSTYKGIKLLINFIKAKRKVDKDVQVVTEDYREEKDNTAKVIDITNEDTEI